MISIHALREEGDAKRPDGRYEIKKFLSTPSARRATPEVRGQKGPRNISIHALREEGDLQRSGHDARHSDFYPRPPRGGRRTPCPRLRHSPNFYPRPPRGGRHELRLISGCRFLFLSTPSARRATHRCAGGLNVQADFYPRPPRGGRRSRLDAVPPAGIFLSTPSARRATLCRVLHRQAGRISIHALREEGDQGPRSEAGHRTDFYPRPPRGGRHRFSGCFYARFGFLSTPSARRATGRKVWY